MGYRSTFVCVAEDCRATTGEVPPARVGTPSVAACQYALLAGQPGRWTEEDVLLASSPALRGRADVSARELEQVREQYFSRPRACLRASPLPKTFGWGLHYDEQGRITLYARGSADYTRLSQDPSLTRLKAMRTRRG